MAVNQRYFGALWIVDLPSTLLISIQHGPCRITTDVAGDNYPAFFKSCHPLHRSRPLVEADGARVLSTRTTDKALDARPGNGAEAHSAWFHTRHEFTLGHPGGTEVIVTKPLLCN